MLSLAAAVSAEFVIKHSRFVVHAGPVDDQAATLAFFESVCDPAATHNCWAWKLGAIHRFNDDGEPSGTAGRPIFSAIEGKDLDQVMVVVTRYFGGTKLGAGGLVRAYSGCTARCLDQAQLLEHHPVCRRELEAGFEWTGAVHAALESCEARKLSESFATEGVKMQIEVRQDRLRRLQTLLRDVSRGSVRLRCS